MSQHEKQIGKRAKTVGPNKLGVMDEAWEFLSLQVKFAFSVKGRNVYIENWNLNGNEIWSFWQQLTAPVKET